MIITFLCRNKWSISLACGTIFRAARPRSGKPVIVTKPYPRSSYIARRSIKSADSFSWSSIYGSFSTLVESHYVTYVTGPFYYKFKFIFKCVLYLKCFWMDTNIIYIFIIIILYTKSKIILLCYIEFFKQCICLIYNLEYTFKVQEQVTCSKTSLINDKIHF